MIEFCYDINDVAINCVKNMTIPVTFWHNSHCTCMQCITQLFKTDSRWCLLLLTVSLSTVLYVTQSSLIAAGNSNSIDYDLKTMPSENGSNESTSSSSASPPRVIIWYISLSRIVMMLKPAMNSSSRRRRRSSCCLRWLLRMSVMWSSSATRFKYISSYNITHAISSTIQGCYSQLATYELMLVIRCKATFNNIHYCCNNEAARSAHNAVDYIYRQIHTGQITNNDLRPPEHTH